MGVKVRSIEQVKALLMRMNKLQTVAYGSGGFENITDLLIDIKRFIKECDLSDRQREILDLYYIQGYTQAETAERLEITQQGVSFHLTAIDKKLQDSLKVWKRRGF